VDIASKKRVLKASPANQWRGMSPSRSKSRPSRGGRRDGVVSQADMVRPPRITVPCSPAVVGTCGPVVPEDSVKAVPGRRKNGKTKKSHGPGRAPWLEGIACPEAVAAVSAVFRARHGRHRAAVLGRGE